MPKKKRKRDYDIGFSFAIVTTQLILFIFETIKALS